jgi:hypothetical protein
MNQEVCLSENKSIFSPTIISLVDVKHKTQKESAVQTLLSADLVEEGFINGVRLGTLMI